MERESSEIENPIFDRKYKGLNHFLCSDIYSNGIRENRKQNVTEAKTLIYLYFISVGWHFFVSIYTVMSKKEICYKSQMVTRHFETIDFTSIFKGYRIPIPFSLLCIESITTIRKQYYHQA